jgi:hypothetical protein
MLHANTQICHYAYTTLCDLLISMSPHLVDKNPDYQVLIIEINENLIQSLLTFLNTYVFFAEEPKSNLVFFLIKLTLIDCRFRSR